MYLNYYGLRKEPFHITPDPEFLYLSPSHKEALAAIIYGIEQKKGFVTITGAVGVGKTTILRSYLDRAEKSHLKLVYIFNSDLTFKELLETIYQELDIAVESKEIPGMINDLYNVLIEEYKKGNTIVLVVDEAQNMPVHTLESLRMISNLETSKDKLLQIVLVGQPEFEEILNLPTMRQLKQRIAIRATILALTKDESVEYMKLRLLKAGARAGHIFTRGAVQTITKTARGIPRIINILCDNALITGFGRQTNPVTKAVAREIIRDFRGLPARSFSKRAIAATVAGALLILVLGGIAYVGLVDSKKLSDFVKSVPWGQNKQHRTISDAEQFGSPSREVVQERSEKPSSDSQAESPVTTRKVVIGDTLSKLALEMYGNSDVSMIKMIQEHNPGITDPDTIHLGSTIRFPVLPTNDPVTPGLRKTRSREGAKLTQ